MWLWLAGVKGNFKERILLGSGVFWLVITPIIWGLNRFLGILLRPKIFWVLTGLITLILLVYFWIKNKHKFKIKTGNINIKVDWWLIIVLMVYGCLHLVFYRFYVTMPEWDGYTNILRIEEMVNTGVINYQYRPLFYTGMTILTQVTGIGVYQIHVVWMVALSAIYLVLMGILIDKNKIKDWRVKLLILFSGLAVPVINMEIDFFRPQSLYLILFPIIFWLERKNKNYLAWLVSLVGLGYHQFFIFPVIILGLKIFLSFSTKNKLLSIIPTGLLLGYFGDKIIKYLPVNRIFENITRVDKWRWWFLNSYQTFPDNVEMGWPGIGGAIKYYGYYFGPLILFGLVILIFNLRKFTKNNKYWLIMIGLLLGISEVLPRLNVVYLPERFPLLIGIVSLFLLPDIIRIIKFSSWWWLVVLILIGLSGSIYIAKNKNSSTDKEELKVAEWIKDNTPEDAFIFGQKNNDVLIMYFGRRRFIEAKESFWVNGSYSVFGKYRDIFDWSDYYCGNCYAIYSKRKFSGLMSERGYWDEYSYSQANLDNLDNFYQRVYDHGDVIIWKL